MPAKKCPCENTFNSREGFEGLQSKLEKEKVDKPFPTYEEVEKSIKSEPKGIWKVK